MGYHEVKLGALLKFNSEKEKDIIKFVEELLCHRQLGGFISSIIRVAFENPDLIKKAGLSGKDYDLTSERKKFFEEVETEIKEMRSKIDTIFNMTSELYMLAQFGKRLALESRAENLLMAQFILQKQTNDLCKALGVSSLSHIYESSRIDAIKQKVDETLEFIINNYDGIVNEIKNNSNTSIKSSGVIEKYDTSNICNENYNNNINNHCDNISGTIKVTDNNDKEHIINKDKSININSNLLNNNKEDNITEDEVIDFGSEANWEALNMFIGGL